MTNNLSSTAAEQVTTPAGIHYPKNIDPIPLLGCIELITDTTQRNMYDPFTERKIPGPRQLIISEREIESHANPEAVTDLFKQLNIVAKQVNLNFRRPKAIVLIYGENAYLTPHTDQDGSGDMFLTTLTGYGRYQTFGLDDDVITAASRFEYPEGKQLTETVLGPGDVFIPNPRVLHGFINGKSPRIAVGLTEEQFE